MRWLQRFARACSVAAIAVLLAPAVSDAATGGTGGPSVHGGGLAEGTFDIPNGPAGDWKARPRYVTSDNPTFENDGATTHATTPGSPAGGVDHDGVADLIVNRSDGNFRCSGALLNDGQTVLTAAHCLTDSNGNVITNSVSATWELSGSDVSESTSSVRVHSNWNGSVTDGFDVAAVNFDQKIDSNVPRYRVFRESGQAELHSDTVKFGYGQTGFGNDGASGGTSGTKRYGNNEWEDDGLGDNGVSGINNNATQLTYDFDSNVRNLDSLSGDDSDHDAFQFFFNRAEDLGFGDDEVGSAPGDSGGPTFILDDGVYKIAGVTSYGLRLEQTSGPPPRSSDVDGDLNSTWGEFAVDARAAEPSMQSFIDENLVPAPATLAMLAPAGLALVRRRRRAG